MKKPMKKVVGALLTFSLIITAVPTQNVNAITKNAITKNTMLKNIEVRSQKAESDTSYEEVLNYAYNQSYNMTIRIDNSENTVLCYTTDGRTYMNLNLDSIVEEKFGSDITDISYNDITCWDDVFFITGSYNDHMENFYISTTDAKTFEAGEMESSEGSGFELGYLYKIGSTYVYTVREGYNMGGDINGGKAPFYTSKDLKNWKLQYTPKNKNFYEPGQAWTLECITANGMIISSNKISSDGEYYSTDKFYYTKDLKTFKEIKSGINNQDAVALWSSSFDCTTFLCKQFIFDKKSNFTELKLLTSTNCTTWKPILKYNPKKYSSNDEFYKIFDTKKKMTVFLSRVKDNSMFIYTPESKEFTEYKTNIRASVLGARTYDDKDEYAYIVYNKKYILVSKDSFKTAYKIETPLNKIRTIDEINGVLLLQGSDNYYISTEDIHKAME